MMNPYLVTSWTVLLLLAVGLQSCAAEQPSVSASAWPDHGEGEAWKWLHGLSEEQAGKLVAEIPKRIEKGPFQPTLESLRNYKCPEWFRDAKFGIWVCYGPQSVPAKSGWYGRQMYQNLLKYHTETYGHPSKFGFKDFIPDLTAAKFDADDLVGRFKQAGAKYFIALADHHENFDLWNSKYHRWNAARMGPKKDMIGLWRTATLKHGLRWGVTTHLARSLTWFQVSHGEDKGGKFDGNDPAYWDFYHKPYLESTSSYPTDAPASWRLQWFLRVKDLIDNYQPDLMYFDGSVPFKPDGRPGLDIIAHLYNASTKWHGGENHAVMNIKDRTSGIYDDHIATLDLERQQLLDIRDRPWQNDTSIGPWFYTNGAKYKQPPAVIHMLVDIVSKNGNLLLNVPMRADGTLDAEAKTLLKDIGRWMDVNGEAIYGTRPWIVAGENTARRAAEKRWGGTVGEAAQRTGDRSFKLAAGEVRFTAKGDDTLYAVIAGWPEDGKVMLSTLARPAASKASVACVELLGHKGELKASLTTEGLAIQLPDRKPCDHAWALKITGKNLRDFKVPAKPAAPAPAPVGKPGATVQADSKGVFTLTADTATVHGSTPKVEQKPGAKGPNVGHWRNPKDYVSWALEVAQGGEFDVQITYSCAKGAGGSGFTVEVGDQKLVAASEETGSWGTFKSFPLGRIKLAKAAKVTLAVRPKAKWKVIGLQSIVLRPVKP